MILDKLFAGYQPAIPKVHCSLQNTQLDNLETTEGAELSRSRSVATAEVLSCTTSIEIITLASNISVNQLQTGNFGFQDTVYFTT